MLIFSFAPWARAVVGLLISIEVAALAAAPRALPADQLPADARLKPLKDLDGYFPFTPPTSKIIWADRADRVRRQILVSQGLWPMPTKTPLNAVIHGKIEREEYTVEKVYFESAPGFFVTGNLYRPRNVQGKVPAVLFAHGHWKDARGRAILCSKNQPRVAAARLPPGLPRLVAAGRAARLAPTPTNPRRTPHANPACSIV